MDSQSVLSAQPPARPASALRRWYWNLHRFTDRRRRESASRANLAQLRKLARALPAQQPGNVEIDGLRLRFDDAKSLYVEFKHIFGWGIYDFRPTTNRPRILDCGGHIGLGVLRAKRLAPEARITVFEPDERVLPLLRANLLANGAGDVEIVNAALAASNGRANFLGDGADGGALVPEFVSGGRSVATVALSDYLTEPIDFLKMNIEGAELPVLREAASRLSRVGELVLEYHGFPHTGQVLHEILGLLHDCGFRYALHHFDAEVNPALRPPFRLSETTRFFQLVAAKRVWKPRSRDYDPDSPSAVSVGHGGPTLLQRRNDEPPAPLSRVFGHDRGWPIDRTYIEGFLADHAERIKGTVLEVAEATYTRRFGALRVTRSEVLHIEAAAGATLVADLTHCPQILDATFDCLILTQTLPVIFDLPAAIANCHRILRPGGCLLLTVPGISQRSAFDAGRWGDYWRFTPQSVERLLAKQFRDLRIQSYGNVRAATALLEGRAAQELTPLELNHVDPDYPVIVGAVAVRDSEVRGRQP